MPSPSLVLPGVLFVGEDDRSRIVAHTGPAAGWFVPNGIRGWSSEVSVVAREALTEEIRRATKAVLPEEQIPPARYPLTYQAALKSPLIAVSSKLAPKLVEAGILVHTVGLDRVTSSFYYLSEGGSEEPVRVESDLVDAAATMLGERADNAAIERVLDGLVDRLIRTLSQGRVSELGLELVASLPRAAADGSGLADVDLDAFEKQLAQLVSSSEQYAAQAQEIASKLGDTNDRIVDVPLFGEARKVSQGPFDIEVGGRKISLPTYERWTMTRPLGNGEAEAASAKAAAEKAAAEKAAAEKAAAEKAAKAEAERKAAAAKAEAERKAAAEKAAAEKKAAEEKAAAEKKAAEEKAAAEKKAAEEKAAAEKKAAEEKAAAEKAEAEKKAAEEKAAAEKKAAEEKAAAEKKAAEEKTDKKAIAKKTSDAVEPAAGLPKKSSGTIVFLLVAIVGVGFAIWHFLH